MRLKSLYLLHSSSFCLHQSTYPKWSFWNQYMETIDLFISVCSIFEVYVYRNCYKKIGQYLHWKPCYYYERKTNNKLVWRLYWHSSRGRKCYHPLGFFYQIQIEKYKQILQTFFIKGRKEKDESVQIWQKLAFKDFFN